MKRSGWIDFSKGIAIIAVILDHAFLIYPAFYRQLVWQHMMFAVLWFVMLSGVTNAISANKSGLDTVPKILRFWIKRMSAIYIPYLIASVVYYFTLYHKVHTVSELFIMVVNFRVMPLFYFVHLILQLYLIFPLLFLFAKKFNRLWIHGIVVVGLTLVTVVYFPVKVPPWTILLGQDYFARSYLVLFYIGIVFALRKQKVNWTMGVGLIALFIGMERYNITTNFHMIGGIPTIPWILWSLAGLGVVKLLHDILPKNPLFQLLRFLGQESMYIYLFHYAILTLISENAKGPFLTSSFIVTISSAIGIPVLLHFLYQRASKKAILFHTVK